MRKGVITMAIPLVLVGSALAGCGSNGGSSSNTYGSTSNKGDYAEWTINGSDLSVVWQKIDATGAVGKTLNVSATCGAAHATFGYRTCTVSTASCTNGTQSCGSNDTPSAGDTFDILEQPGVALWVHTGSGNSGELHVGLLLDKNGCSATVNGDYVYSRLDTSNDSVDLFGFYRSDATFNTVSHADFKMVCTGNCNQSADTGAVFAAEYSTGGSGQETLTGSECSNGVRTRSLAGIGTVRSMMTSSGVFILDLPDGSGGIISFKTSNAATLADFGGKRFYGISFPDNSEPKLIAGTTGTVSGSDVSVSVTFSDGSSGTASISKLSSGNGQAYAVPAAFTGSANPLAATFNTIATWESAGLFKISTVGGGNNVVLSAAKLNGKLVGFGTVYNTRDNGAGGTITKNTGNFLLFEAP